MIPISRAWLVQRAADGHIPGAHRTGGTNGHWRFDADRFDHYVADLRAGRARSRPTKATQRKPRTPKSVVVQDWLYEFKRGAMADLKARA